MKQSFLPKAETKNMPTMSSAIVAVIIKLPIFVFVLPSLLSREKSAALLANCVKPFVQPLRSPLIQQNVKMAHDVPHDTKLIYLSVSIVDSVKSLAQ